MQRWGADERSEERKGVWGKPCREIGRALRQKEGSLRGGAGPRLRIPESTLSGDLKVHYAPGALTNVVRKGRGFGGNHEKTSEGTDLQASGVYFCGKKTFAIDTRHCSCFRVPKSVF